MRSIIAALRTLVLPFGATSGLRIVLDGINGLITVYDANSHRRVRLGGGSGGTGAVQVSSGDANEAADGLLVADTNGAGGSQRLYTLLRSPFIGTAPGNAAEYLFSGTNDATQSALWQFWTGDFGAYYDLTRVDNIAASNIKAGAAGGALGTLPTLEEWTAFPYAAGWADQGAPSAVLKYRLNALNELEIQGTLRDSSGAGHAAGAAIGTLPVGYRPTQNHITSAQVASGGAVMTYNILSTGVVSPRQAFAASNFCALNATVRLE